MNIIDSFGISYSFDQKKIVVLQNLIVKRKIMELTHSFPVHFFSTPWKHQKTVKFSDVFKG